MKAFIAFSALVAVAMAKPGAILAPAVHYAYQLGAPIGLDGRVVDTPEVAVAKANHFAQYNYEAVRNSLGAPVTYNSPVVAYGAAYTPAAYTYGALGAPIGLDGRVVDTPEVAQAKFDHLIAHANEAAKTAGAPYGALAYAASPVYAYGYPYSAPIGADGRVVDTPEVAHAKAAHLIAHAEAAAKSGH